MPEFKTKDSGKRRKFKTGAQRDISGGKGRYDLIPREAIHRLAQLFERGAVKYADRNWEKGLPLHSFIDSGVRHYFKFLRGDTDEPHDRAFMWNLIGALRTQLVHPDLIDLPFADTAV